MRVPPGGTFYAQVAYEDPDGITSISVNLVNSSPPGLEGSLSPDQGGFEIVDVSTDTCDLSGTATAVTCVYTIQVTAETQNIDQLPEAGEEFAYVFRTRVTDGRATCRTRRSVATSLWGPEGSRGSCCGRERGERTVRTPSVCVRRLRVKRIGESLATAA